MRTFLQQALNESEARAKRCSDAGFGARADRYRKIAEHLRAALDEMNTIERERFGIKEKVS